MNNTQTLERLRQMRLGAMASLHGQYLQENQIEDMTTDEYLAVLVDHQWEERLNKKIERLIKQAKFRQKASLPEVKYTPKRSLDKNTFMRLGTLDFINRRENIIITGPTGVGKSYLAQALGHQACLMEYKTKYYSTAKLLHNLKASKIDGTYLKELKSIGNVQLLILDDFGLQAFDNTGREILMDIIDERYDEKATIISSQLPVSTWHEIIGENTIADAILDRMVNSSHRIKLEGESLRKEKLKSI